MSFENEDQIPNMSSSDFNDVLKEIGSWGKYQKKVFYLFLLPLTMAMAFRMAFIFTLAIPDHHCHVPVPYHVNMTQDEWNDIVLPRLDGKYDKCQKYDLNPIAIQNIIEGTAVSMDFYNTTVCNEENFIYDEQHYIRTVITENHWVCDKVAYSTIILTAGQGASLIGSIVFGYLSDRVLGRKLTCYIQFLPVIIGNAALLFQPPFWVYCLFHSLSMMPFPSLFEVMFVLLAEQVHDSKRVLLNGVSYLIWTLGMCFLSLIAWLLRGHWFYLILIQVLAYIPLLFTYKIVRESPRWLLFVGKLEEAAEECKNIAEINGKRIPDNLRLRLEYISQTKNATVGISQVCNSKVLVLRSAILIFIWMSVELAYSGVQLNIGNLGGNPYLNFFFMSVVEIMSFILGMLGMEKLGRRITQMLALFGFCISCWTYVMLPAGSSETSYIIVSIFAKMCGTASFLVIYQQAVEIFPTVLRSLGMALGTISSQLTGLFTPAIIFLANTWYPMPFLVFGVFGTLSLIISPFIPETYNKALSETIEDAERFERKQKFFSLNLHNNKPETPEFVSMTRKDEKEA